MHLLVLLSSIVVTRATTYVPRPRLAAGGGAKTSNSILVRMCDRELYYRTAGSRYAAHG